jgi:high-affinity Fe2+/Pb2+ permease
VWLGKYLLLWYGVVMYMLCVILFAVSIFMWLRPRDKVAWLGFMGSMLSGLMLIIYNRRRSIKESRYAAPYYPSEEQWLELYSGKHPRRNGGRY